MCVLAHTHTLDWSGFIPLKIPTSQRTPQGDESQGHEEEAPALPASPSLPIFPFCIICCLISGGRETKASGSWTTAGTLSSLACDFGFLIGKQKEVLSCHSKVSWPSGPGYLMPLSTGIAARGS